MHTNWYLHIILLQVHPVVMMGIGLVCIGLLAAIFWPSKGLLASFDKTKKLTEKEQLEDILKFIFDKEYNDLPVSVSLISSQLDISDDTMESIMAKLKQAGLIIYNSGNIKLSDEGRKQALNIIRVHRIWESYLANKTSVKADDWHAHADDKEHQISLHDINKISATIGNPVFDPHGDPIPTADGYLPEKKGKPLSAAIADTNVRITHIEDEPADIFDQLIAMGLYPGVVLHITEVSKQKIKFIFNGETGVLVPAFAAQLTVQPVEPHQEIMVDATPLSSLKVGESAIITGISPQCRGQQRRRLMDLGIIPGSSISAEIESSSGDPVGYRIKGATIGIRKDQSSLIYVKDIINSTL